MNYEVIIVGVDPAIITALELNKIEPNKKILLIEAGKSIDKRCCLKVKTNKCVSCKPYCHITTKL